MQELQLSLQQIFKSIVLNVLPRLFTVIWGRSQTTFIQDEVGRYSKHVNFYRVECANEGGRWVKKATHLST